MTFKNEDRLIKILIITLLMCTFSSYFAILALIISIYYMLTSNVNKIYLLLFTVLPFANIFKFESYSISFFTLLSLLSTPIIIIKIKKINVELFLIYLIFLLYVLIRPIYSFQHAIKISSFIAILFSFILIKNLIKTNDILSYYRKFVLGTILSSFIALFKTKIKQYNNVFNIETDYFQFNGVYYERFSGLFTDANYYALLTIMLLIIGYMLLKTQKINNTYYWIIASILSVFGFLTLSKSFFILYITLVFYIIFDNIKKISKSNIILICSIVVIIIFFIIIPNVEFITIILNRFRISNNLNSLTTGRVSIWLLYIKQIIKKPSSFFLGYGIYAPRLENKVVHNLYLEIMYELGLIGLIIIFYIVIKAIKKHNNWISIPLIFLFVALFFLNGLYAFEFPFYIILSIMSTRRN